VCFASYGGVSKFDGQNFTVLLLSRDYCEQDKEGFFKSKMYVGTEQGVSIIDIKTNKVVSPQVPTQKRILYVYRFLSIKESIFFCHL
jgi:ligand-binding sensor domain-containing protein